MTAATAPVSLDHIIAVFEHLSADGLDALDTIYAADAWFKDPFNEVTGRDAVRRIFAHMFVALAEPRFVVCERAQNGADALLVWEMQFRFRAGRPRGPQVIRGATHLRRDAHGRIVRHRDYWDAAEELYEKLPLVGSLMRGLKRLAHG